MSPKSSDKDDAPKEVVGGAIAQEVEVKDVAETSEAPVMMEVVTTALGTVSALGIVPVGTKMSIPVDAYSPHWMQATSKKELLKYANAGKDDAD